MLHCLSRRLGTARPCRTLHYSARQRRLLCTTSESAPPPSASACLGAGLAGGGFGGLVGIGGGAIMVPIMTSVAKMTQHQAVGTSSAAVAGTGLAGMVSFGSAGAVDLGAAAALASTAMLTARFGARFTQRFNPVQLQRAFACFQLAVGPLVPLKAQLVERRKVAGGVADETRAAANDASAPAAASPPQLVPDAARAQQLLMLAGVGVAAGFASGMFGIGGGVILTPALCLLTEMPHACVLGTTLASMVPPSLVSAATHRQMGNVVTGAVAPLVLGSAVGAAVAGQLAVRSPEEPLQWGFAAFLVLTGGRKLWTLRGL